MVEILRRVLRWRWVLVLAVFLPSAGVAVALVETRADTVEAVAVVGVSPQSLETANDALLTLTVQRYAVQLSANSSLVAVARRVGVDVEDVRDGVDVNVTTASANLSISATMADEDTAVSVANAMANRAVDLGDDDTFMDVDVLSPGTTITPSFLASRRLLEAVLLLVALAAALAVAYAVEVTRPRIRSGGDAEEATAALVVGSLRTFPKAGRVQKTPKDEDILRAARILRSGFVASGRRLPPGGTTCVVGTRADAGATTVAFLVARSASDSGAGVALIDGDLEEAGLSRNLGLPHDAGLDDVLHGRAEARRGRAPRGGCRRRRHPRGPRRG